MIEGGQAGGLKLARRDRCISCLTLSRNFHTFFVMSTNAKRKIDKFRARSRHDVIFILGADYHYVSDGGKPAAAFDYYENRFLIAAKVGSQKCYWTYGNCTYPISDDFPQISVVREENRRRKKSRMHIS